MANKQCVSYTPKSCLPHPKAELDVAHIPLQVQQKLETLLGNTVDIPGENNSVLLVGPRGVGKTLVMISMIAFQIRCPAESSVKITDDLTSISLQVKHVTIPC